MIRPLRFAPPLVGILLAAASHAEVSVSVRLEPDLIGLGQTVTLTLEARGDNVGDLELDPSFSLDKLELVSGPMQSQTWQFVNGRASRAESLSWRLKALEIGTARIGRLTLGVNEEVFELPDQVIEVQKEPVATTDPFGRRRVPDPFEAFPFTRRQRRSGRAAEPKLFLRAEVSNKSPYAGQQVLYTLYLFTQADVGSINPDEVPSFEGFWVQEIPQPDRLTPEMIELDGQRYGRVVLLQKAIFPLRSGTVRLEPVEARIVAKIPEYSWLGSVFERTTEIKRTSNPVTLSVQDLPTPPSDLEGFAGAVGRFELSTHIEPSDLRVGEAATLTVSVSGQGNIEGLRAPELPALDGVRVFPPEQSGGSSLAGTRVRGQKTWTYVLVPDRPGEWDLPVLTYSYFDPRESEYRSSHSPSAVLRALPELGSVDTVDVAEIASPGSEASNGASGAGEDARISTWLRNPWVVGSSIATLAVLFLVPSLGRLRRRSRISARLRNGLRDIGTETQGRRAAEAIESAWREYFVDRFGIPTAVTSSQWPQELQSKRVSRNSISDLSGLVEDLNYLRYAPELSASEGLRTELIARSLRLSRSL